MRTLFKTRSLISLSILLGLTFTQALSAQPRWDGPEGERHPRYEKKPYEQGELEEKRAERLHRGTGQGMGKNGAGFMEQMVRGLELDQKQREELKGIMLKRKEAGDGNPRLRVMRSVQELNEAIADGSDEEINKLVDEIREASLQAAKTSREFQKILTDEQRSKLGKFRERFKQMKHERKGEFKQEFRDRFREGL